MPFRFHLRDPPCDIAFLSIVDSESLYNDNASRTRDVKEATIRQMGWHSVDLPQDWFLSRQALDTVRNVFEAMQCTIQYLRYCCKNEERRAQKSMAQLHRCEEERAAAFEELIELRETVALYKHQLRELGRERQRSGSIRSRTPVGGVEGMRQCGVNGGTGQHLPCSFCSNVYPSRHALESHFRKRHKRSEGYAAMAAASAAVLVEEQKQQEHSETTTPVLIATQQASSSLPFVANAPIVYHEAADRRGDRSLREEISELRLVVAKMIEQQAELHRGISPACLAALPQKSPGVAMAAVAPGIGMQIANPLPGLKQRSSAWHNEDVALRLQRELVHTNAQLQQLNSTLDAEGAKHDRGAGDGGGAFHWRDHTPQSLRQEKQLGHLTVAPNDKALPHLNLQDLQHPPSLSDRTVDDDGGASRRKGYAGDSLVSLSPITPPAKAVGNPYHAVDSGKNSSVALQQNCGHGVSSLTSGGYPCGNPSGAPDTLEPTRPISVLRKMSTSSSFPLNPDIGSRGGDDDIDAARNHGGLTPLSTPHESHRDTPTSTGDGSPIGVNSTTAGVSGKKTASRDAVGQTRVLPGLFSHSQLGGMEPAVAMEHLGTGGSVSAYRYDFSVSEESTSRTTERLSSAAPRDSRVPQVVLPTSPKADATQLPQSVEDGITTGLESAHTASATARTLQHQSNMEADEDLAPRKRMQRSSGSAQSGVDGAHRLPIRHIEAGDEGQGSTQLRLGIQAPPTSRIAPIAAPSLSSRAKSDVDPPQRSTSPLAARSTQRSHAEMPGSMVTGPEENSSSDSSESPSSRRYGRIAPIQQVGVTAGQSVFGSTPKVIPVVQLVPEASFKSRKPIPQNLEKSKQGNDQGKESSPYSVVLAPPLGLDGGVQNKMPSVQNSPPSGGEGTRRSRSSGAGHDADRYSVAMPLSEALEHDAVTDGPFSIPLDTTLEGESPLSEVGFGDPVIEDVLSDTVPDVTPPPVSKAHTTPLRTVGDRDMGDYAVASRLTSSHHWDLADDGDRTPSQAVPPSAESLSGDYSYYSYSYSDDEESIPLQDSAAAELHAENAPQPSSQEISVAAESVAVTQSATTWHPDAGRTVHRKEVVAHPEVGVKVEDTGGVGAEAHRKLSRVRKGDTKPSGEQLGAPPQKQPPPALLPSREKETKNDSSTAKQRHTSPMSVLAPQEALKKTKRLFKKLFSKKSR
ncbi:hypothetical protein JKF63_03017 [Porcisia hertigi]|uniref:C2H2-type domain-containing protein n=1 Tax=Porcisia hertigi TaxID=2761500 RepID=A0A836HWB9_9TRYP|nr:hypothetical protein JKF63_03017 [Porcisia hertigi]